jgi:hypothetical protein
MMNEPLDLGALYDLADAAAPGPWAVRKTVDGEILIDYGDGYTVGGTNTSEDAEFIAQARTLVPALIAELCAARIELSENASIMKAIRRQRNTAEATVARMCNAMASRPITTHDELNALPAGSIVVEDIDRPDWMDVYFSVANASGDLSWISGGEAVTFKLPVTAVYVPEVKA